MPDCICVTNIWPGCSWPSGRCRRFLSWCGEPGRPTGWDRRAASCDIGTGAGAGAALLKRRAGVVDSEETGGGTGDMIEVDDNKDELLDPAAAGEPSIWPDPSTAAQGKRKLQTITSWDWRCSAS